MYPNIRGIQISFFRWTGFTKEMHFIGLENYKNLLKDPYIFKYIGHNVFMFGASLICSLFGLMISAILAGKIRGSNFYRIIYFFPNVISVAAVAVLWSLILSPNIGLLNTILRGIGLNSLARTWMGPTHALKSIGVINIWWGFGWYMLLYIAGIQNIPKTYYDAAEIDGANSIQSFFLITIPLIWELMRTILVYILIGALNIFALVHILNSQMPNPHTDMVANYFYWQSFSNYNWGYATSIVVIIFIITFTASILTWHLTKAQTTSY